MRTNKTLVYDQLKIQKIDSAISKFSQRLMSNSKWVRLVDSLIENIEHIIEIQFKKIQTDKIGQLYLDANTTYKFDYWHSGFEGNNSFGEWLEFREIEYLIFPKFFDTNKNQDLEKISTIIKSIGEFYLELDEYELRLICYKE